MNKGIIVGIGAIVIIVLAAGSFFGIAAKSGASLSDHFQRSERTWR